MPHLSGQLDLEQSMWKTAWGYTVFQIFISDCTIFCLKLSKKKMETVTCERV